MKTTIKIMGFLFIYLFISTSAFASPVNLPQTGQTKCYDTAGVEIPCAGTGQDGEIQAGVAWPSSRFTLSGDCVTDNLTGLMWPRNGNLAGTTINWDSAIDYANNLTLCGYSDWRLPNINELESLVNADVPDTATWLNTQGFYNVQSSGIYWSSTTGADGTSSAWLVGLWSGNVGSSGKDYNGYVWPVRSTSIPLAELWKTGQTTSYRAGDDGDLEMGAAWTNPRLTVGTGVEADCVTDNLTGLMWLKNANCINTNYPSFDNDYTYGDGKVTWQHALDFVNGINNNAYINCGAGYTDWRLPNRKELRSLIDYSKSSPALPMGHPFTNVQSFYYWSSTTHAYFMDSARVFGMWYGYVGFGSKVGSQYVWPVRLGQSGSFDYYCDDDNDTYISSTISGNCTGSGCVPAGCQTTQGDDCNDNDLSINPGATEILKNGIDDDCNSSTPDSADLYVSSLSALSSATAGESISVSDTTNKSGVSLVGATTTKIYFSTDNKWWTNDTYLGSRAVPAFGAGAQSSSGSTDVTIPANTCTKTYYLIAKADADTLISEWNEGNNNRAVSIAITRPDPSADLYVSSVTAPSSANAGDAITVTDTTNKSGCATGASTTRVYLSKYANGYAGIEIGSGRAVPASTSNLGAQTNSGSISGTIPSGGCTGSCYIVVKADADGAIGEWNEGNNKRATAITIGL